MIQVFQLMKDFYVFTTLKNAIYDSEYWNEVIKILFSDIFSGLNLENRSWIDLVVMVINTFNYF
jgi:hypothetical protein